MLAGRQYTPEDIVRLLLKWYWLILIPWAIGTVGAYLYSRSLPNRYRSESVIQVVPQRVPESLVRSTITAGIQERLPAIEQQILSRTRLERIIQDFGLYAEERKTQLMEDIVRRMGDEISVYIVKGDAFRVNYQSTDAKTAMKVTERLAALFVEENLRDREVLAEGANQFLDSQLDDARRRLLEHEKKLEDFRRQYNGQLPSQMAGNVQAMQSAQSQTQGLGESIIRDRDRRLVLERMLADAAVEPTPPPAAPRAPDAAAAGGAAAPVSFAGQLDAAKASLEVMRLRLKPEHPDVMRMQRTINELEKRVAAEALQVPLSPAPLTSAAIAAPVALSPAEKLRQNRLREINTEIESLDREIERKTEMQRKLQVMLTDLQRRVNETPTRESDLVALTRDYDTLQKVYTSLLQKSEDAKVAANLERRQIGEQFKVIDAARLPEQPFSPNRQRINLMGFGGGLAFGLLLLGLIEYRDNSFRTDEEIQRLLLLPVLATIPTIVTAADTRARRRTRALAGAAATVLLLGAGVAVAWRLDMLDRWL